MGYWYIRKYSLQSVPQQLADRSACPVMSWTPSHLVSCEVTP
jgi:hypothetical protein